MRKIWPDWPQHEAALYVQHFSNHAPYDDWAMDDREVWWPLIEVAIE